MVDGCLRMIINGGEWLLNGYCNNSKAVNKLSFLPAIKHDMVCLYHVEK